MRKIISVILPAALLLTALAAAPASAAEQAADNPFRFSVLSDGTAQITHCNIREGNVTVPAEIDGRAVTEIGEMAFSFSALTGVDLPDSLRAVGRQAFLNCRSLQSIRFPDSLESVDYRAFDNTAWYTIQPDGVVYAGKVAYGCKGACPAKIELAEGTVGVASWAFRDCSALAEIAVPDSVRYIGAYAFNGTAWLDSQPDGIVYAGRVAYKMKGVCPSQAVIREGTVSIAENAFYGCADALQSVVIPDTVTAIGRGAFSQCCSLTDVVIPDSVTAIGENAFDRCSSLQTITVPASVSFLGMGAFGQCSRLKDVTLDAPLREMDSLTFQGCCSLAEIRRPDTVTIINSACFDGCTSLRKVTFPDSLTAIETGAFRDCTALADVTLPDSLQYVSGGAFRGTPWLDAQPDGILYLGKTLWYVKGKYDKGLVIEDGTEMIADYAFDGCESLFSVTLPASVKRLKSSVFSDTAAPQYLEILNPECDIPMYDYAIPASAVICGYMCSTADVYAAKFGRRFIALDYGVPGDVDMDGKPTVLDVTLVQRKEAEMVTLSDKQFRKADVNGDGKVNILDATFLQRALAEMVILPDLSDVAG